MSVTADLYFTTRRYFVVRLFKTYRWRPYIVSILNFIPSNQYSSHIISTKTFQSVNHRSSCPSTLCSFHPRHRLQLDLLLSQQQVQWRAEAVGCPGPTRFLDALENTLYS